MTDEATNRVISKRADLERNRLRQTFGKTIKSGFLFRWKWEEEEGVKIKSDVSILQENCALSSLVSS